MLTCLQTQFAYKTANNFKGYSQLQAAPKCEAGSIESASCYALPVGPQAGWSLEVSVWGPMAINGAFAKA